MLVVVLGVVLVVLVVEADAVGEFGNKCLEGEAGVCAEEADTETVKDDDDNDDDNDDDDDAAGMVFEGDLAVYAGAPCDFDTAPYVYACMCLCVCMYVYMDVCTYVRVCNYVIPSSVRSS